LDDWLSVIVVRSSTKGVSSAVFRPLVVDYLEIKFRKCFYISVLAFVELLCGREERYILMIGVYNSLMFAAVQIVSEFFKACNYCHEFLVVDGVVELGSV
jgi:hypothetical protein